MATGRIGTTPVLTTRWSKQPAGGTTVLSGLDDNSVSLVYSVGYEQVYRNGTLLSRGNDYTATNGTTITLVDATLAGDVIEVFANAVVPLTDTYSQTVANSLFVNQSTFDAKGDLIAGTGDNTYSKLTVGSNGDTLIADSSTATGLRYSGTNQQNPVINGAYEIWQRGTSFTSSGYTADRWYWNVYGISGRTLSRQVPGSTLPEFAYCARSARNSGNTATDPISLVNSFAIDESLRYAGKTVTLSFYARAGADYSATAKGLLVYMVTGTGTGDVQRATTSYTNDNTSLNTTVTLTTSWQRFTYTATIPSTATQFCVYFQHPPQGTAGTNDWYEVTGVQIDLGSTALPFRRAGGTIAGELAACQRYYYRQGGFANYTLMGQGQAGNSTNANIGVKTPVTMRVSPTSVDYSTLRLSNESAGYAVTNVSINSFFNARDLIGISIDVASGLTIGASYSLQANNSTSGYLGISAEL